MGFDFRVTGLDLGVSGILVKSVPGAVPVFYLEQNVLVSVHFGVPFWFCTVHIYLIIYMKKIKY